MFLLLNERACSVYRRVSSARQPIGYLSFKVRPNHFSRAISVTAMAFSVWILLAGAASGAATWTGQVNGGWAGAERPAHAQTIRPFAPHADHNGPIHQRSRQLSD